LWSLDAPPGLAACLILGLALSRAIAQTDGDSDKVNFLIAQNELTRARLKSGAFSFQEAIGVNVPADPLKRELHRRSGAVLFQDRFRLGILKESAGVARAMDGPIESHIDAERRHVIGPAYSGIWIVGHALAEQYDPPITREYAKQCREQGRNSRGTRLSSIWVWRTCQET
jgi:hypothetical protein